MSYLVTPNPKYDFLGQSYADSYPNLHKYPATMLPQIGIEILKELKLTKGLLLDPYCGSGSSFIAGIEVGFRHMVGYDLNPLAIAISRAKYTPLNKQIIQQWRNVLYDQFYGVNQAPTVSHDVLQVLDNYDYWFSKETLAKLSALFAVLQTIDDKAVQNLFFVPFSETLRECSYTRDNEFKLYRMPVDKLTNFKPNVFQNYLQKLEQVLHLYKTHYLPKLDGIQVELHNQAMPKHNGCYDVVLTSPPYGDSQTTVAYGQFSLFGNEFLQAQNARQLDRQLMGGKSQKQLYSSGVMAQPIQHIYQENPKRAYEVSAFYHDLATSIATVAQHVKRGGKVIYVVGNRTVKKITLPTDQFIAEQFEVYGFKHVVTYQRALSNKVMPARNSPSNQVGEVVNTMLKEYIVVCEKLSLI
jgi:DNA modification methylase